MYHWQTSQSVGCVFVLFMDSFDVQKLFSWMQFRFFPLTKETCRKQYDWEQCQRLCCLIRYVICKYFLPFGRLLFYFVDNSLYCTERLDVGSLAYFIIIFLLSLGSVFCISFGRSSCMVSMGLFWGEGEQDAL